MLLLLLSADAQAARISVQTDRSAITADETFQLVFTVEGEPDGQPDFSVLDKDFEVLGNSQSRNISIVNGKTSRTTRYLVTVLPRHGGELVVPPVSFGKDSSPMLRIPVRAAGAGAKKGGASAANRDVFMEVSLDNERPWVQQQVILTVRIFSRIQWREASLSDPRFQGGEVLMQKLGEDRSYQTRRDGSTWQVIERRYALFPQKSGELRMEPLRLNLRVPDGRKKQRSPFGSFNDPFFDDFFSSRSYRTRVVRSEALELEVQPVPPTFSGRHWLVAGNVQLEENWSGDTSALKTGEPVTLTLSIVADGVTLGQLPELSLPDVQGLRIYPDEPAAQEQVTEQGLRSTSTRKFAIIPTHPGEYELPAVEIPWWNSRTGKEERASIPPRKLVVTGAAMKAPVSEPPSAAAGKPVADVQEQRSQVPSPSLKTASGQVALEGVNYWLLAGNLLLLVLWLGTLVLWLRARKRSHSPSAKEAGEISPPAVDMGSAWAELHAAVQSGDAAATRHALLTLAQGLWPECPPRSLEALAERVEPAVAEELRKLSRQLYADDQSSWNGNLIEDGMKSLGTSRNHTLHRNRDSALKPLYPDAY
ncbi:BatD family protein [Thiolapillus sp.]